MDERRRTRISKFLSYVLRHEPEAIGLELQPGGWADVDALLQGAQASGHRLRRKDLYDVIEGSEKQRFELNAAETAIRARYGHSLSVDLELQPEEPPEFLFHGTARRFLDSILETGLHPRGREWVHLSPDPETASDVGGRHGSPVVLRVGAGRMHEQDHAFYRAGAEVWLTDRVPPEFIERHDIRTQRE